MSILKDLVSPAVGLERVNKEDYEGWQWGAHIEYFSEITNLEQVKLAIVLDQSAIAPLALLKFCEMSCLYPKFNVCFLGSYKGESIGLTMLIEELSRQNIVTMVLAQGYNQTSLAQFKAYQYRKKLVNVVEISNKISYSVANEANSLLGKMLQMAPPVLFHYAQIGYQNFLNDPAISTKLDEYYFELIRLGFAKQNLDNTEPVVRDADAIFCNIASLNYAEAPCLAGLSSGGFRTDELSMVLRFSGMSDKLSSFNISGFGNDANEKEADRTATSVAQLIWYFVDGMAGRKNEYPISENLVTIYNVNIKSLGFGIDFMKSKISDRWWINVPFELKEDCQSHKLYPCSQNDYTQAANGELSQRIMNAIFRYSKHKEI